MNNITIKINALEVTKLIEGHLNKSLAPNVRAKASFISGCSSNSPEPNIPNFEITATVNLVEIDPL